MKTQGKKALLVGINKYQDSKLSNLKFSVNDVSSIYSIFTDPNRGGFTPDNCLLMTDKKRKENLKPIRSNLMSSIRSLSQTAKPDDYILFFFSGHGIEENEKSYLLPSDARINVLRDTALSIDWIKATLKASKANAKVLILDSCHAGAMKGKAESGRMTKGLHDSLFPATEGFAVLSSCKLHEVSYEMPEKKHGVFSYFLIEGLQGDADFDSDGHIMISDASRYTAEKTLDWSFKEGVQQTPNLDSQVVGDLILVNVPSLEDKKVHKKIEKVKQDFSDLNVPISTIEIRPMRSISQKDKAAELARKFSPILCTYLTKHFALNEIEYTKTGYVFPLGEFSEQSASLVLEYDLQELETIDEILVKSASYLKPDRILYYAQFFFDTGKIAKLLKATKWKTLRYDPKLYKKDGKSYQRGPFLEIDPNFPELKQKVIMKFYNDLRISSREGQKSAMVVGSSKEEELDEKSIQFLRPIRFLKLVGNIWRKR